MGWSFPIGSVRGTVLRVHLTFLLLLAFIAFTDYGRGGPAAAAQSLLFVVLLFTCVVLHEFGHVFAARRYGVETRDVTLLPIGGVAHLERIPEEPHQELVIALAGPAVNVVIAAALLLLVGLPNPAAAAKLTNSRIDIAHRILGANIFLVVFNLIPAFPMDGGRVLRAALAWRMGFARGTQVAARVGQGIAFLFGVYGLFSGSAILVFIALFVYLGAASEANAVQIRQAGRGMIAADAMITSFRPLSPHSTIEQAADALIRTTQHEFPVVDSNGHILGVLTRDCIIKALREKPHGTTAAQVMRVDVPVVQGRQALEEAAKFLRQGGIPVVGVVDSEGRLLGYITAENLGELTLISPSREKRRSALNPWKLGPTG